MLKIDFVYTQIVLQKKIIYTKICTLFFVENTQNFVHISQVVTAKYYKWETQLYITSPLTSPSPKVILGQVLC